MFEINKINPEEVKNLTLEEIVKNVIEPDIRKKNDWKEFRTNINNTCSSNGRKAEFDSVNGGSNPSQVAKFKRKIK